MTDNPESGLGVIATILASLGGVGGIGGGALLFRRIMRTEAGAVDQGGREAAHFKRLEEQLAEQKRDIAALTLRADTFAGERNVAEARAAKAEAKLEAIEEKVRTLTEERTAARDLLRSIEEKYHLLETEKATLAGQLLLIQAQYEDLVIENEATKKKLTEVEAIIERRHIAQRDENERLRRGEDRAKPGIVDEP